MRGAARGGVFMGGSLLPETVLNLCLCLSGGKSCGLGQGRRAWAGPSFLSSCPGPTVLDDFGCVCVSLVGKMGQDFSKMLLTLNHSPIMRENLACWTGVNQCFQALSSTASTAVKASEETQGNPMDSLGALNYLVFFPS